MASLTRILRDNYLAVRSAPSVLRWIGFALIVIALGMLPWLIILGATLQGQTQVRMWSSTWIGLDCLEIAGLLATATLLVRRKILVVMAATFTATLFFIDAWFDVMLAQAGSDWYQAIASAAFGEIPLCIICICIAITAPAWCKDETDVRNIANKWFRIVRRITRR